MKKIFTLLVAFLSLDALAAYAPTAPTVTVDNSVIICQTGIPITLVGSVQSGDLRATFRKADTAQGGGGYQVPANKTFLWKGMKVVNLSASNLTVTPVYSDNDIGNDQAGGGTAFTNAVYPGGITRLLNYWSYPLASTGTYEIKMNWTVPANKYPGFDEINAGASGIIAWGCEQ